MCLTTFTNSSTVATNGTLASWIRTGSSPYFVMVHVSFKILAVFRESKAAAEAVATNLTHMMDRFFENFRIVRIA
jgi:hypothetical protein